MKMKSRLLPRCLCIILACTTGSQSQADEKAPPPKPETPPAEKGGSAPANKAQPAKKPVDEAFAKLWEALVKKDEKTALTLMNDFEKVPGVPAGYQAERLKNLLKAAETYPEVKILASKEFSEVAAVFTDKPKPGRKKASYRVTFFRMDGGQWKWADDDVFESKRPAPFISDTSRKQFVELLAWAEALRAELKSSAK